jgi:hypothetical protein
MQEEFIELLKCPNSKMVFHTPVLSNGTVYEDQCCDDPDKVVNVGLKSFITSFFDTFPEYIDLQYKPKLMKINSGNGKVALNSGIGLGNFDIVYNYNNFSLNHLTNDMLVKFFSSANYEEIVYFIDNLINIDEIDNSQNWKVINYICRYCSNNIHLLTYIIERGGSMTNICPNDNTYPLYQILHNSNDEDCIIFAINEHHKANLSLYVTNNRGESIIGKICSAMSIAIIQYALTVMDRNQNDFVNYIDMIIERINGNAKLSENDKECLVEELFK